MNFDTLGVHLGTFRVAQKCQKGLKLPLFSQKCLGRIFGLLFEKIGLLFDQTVWSHCCHGVAREQLTRKHAFLTALNRSAEKILFK